MDSAGGECVVQPFQVQVTRGLIAFGTKRSRSQLRSQSVLVPGPSTDVHRGPADPLTRRGSRMASTCGRPRNKIGQLVVRCSRTSALPDSERALNDDQRRCRDSSVAGGSFDSVCCHGLVTRGGGTGAAFGLGWGHGRIVVLSPVMAVPIVCAAIDRSPAAVIVTAPVGEAGRPVRQATADSPLASA